MDFLANLIKPGLLFFDHKAGPNPSAGQAVDLVIAEPQTINPSSFNVPSTLSIRSSQTDVTRLQSLLFTGDSSLEKWLSNEKARADDADSDDVSEGMLDRMGLKFGRI